MRQRGFDSRPVLSIFDNSVIAQRTHDVAASVSACQAESAGSIPAGCSLAACRKAWNSACFGSTRSPVQIRPRRLDCGGTRAGTGRRLLIALAQVRFLPPQLTTIRKGKPTGDGSRLESGRAAMPWEFDPSFFRLHVPLAERQGLQPSKLARPTLRVGARFDSRRALFHDRGSANGRPPAFEADYGGSSPSPRTSVAMAVSQEHPIRGSCCW
jgi:hypothetical protein